MTLLDSSGLQQDNATLKLLKEHEKESKVLTSKLPRSQNDRASTGLQARFKEASLQNTPKRHVSQHPNRSELFSWHEEDWHKIWHVDLTLWLIGV